MIWYFPNAFAMIRSGCGKYTDAGQRQEDTGQDDEKAN